MRGQKEKKESIEKSVKDNKAKGAKESNVKKLENTFRGKLNDSVLEWFHERPSKGLEVSKQLIMKKDKHLHDNMVKGGKSSEDFQAITGQLRRYLNCQVLSL